MVGEQKIRALLFYLSASIFLIGLPFILSFALGYKFDARNLKFTKTGLIALKTQPQGASIYLDGKLLNEKTPCTIAELLPAKYNIRLELEDHYPWIGEVLADAGKVTRLEKIILFPLRSNIKQLNREKIFSFWVNEDAGEIFYIDEENGIIYKSDLEGVNFKEIGHLPETISFPAKWKVSPDKEKLVCFNPRRIAVAYFVSGENLPPVSFIILEYPHQRITDVFWHSDNYHLIVITDRSIEVVEAKSDAAAVNLANLNKRNATVFYDAKKDILYFLDSQRAEDGEVYDNVYKLELGTRSFPF